ncbi:multidrug efflux transporter transcriptional repressor AcrR [Moellerella wisconsensis]|uniref:TetR family transcriptional repressor n=3 Tax=Moellerella wisconsensis TaxID=158849 RepID=A0A0N0IAU2_9GAMM|nr:multidrug efflux transporter transcriptional repressor AcrR [Moellerella wisconsensis]KLN96006.1 transcriptional regulator [Moellerella wisconsensis]KPD03333.1 TetR family transcriptional repressor [Moellerella wisconsensis ATCC 35017]UNH23585.1 multidrug efflux transporter transcriptional repressor AcrR [Moellerella wisconsensis]UNH26673.1 multidrug efflux transporter transcriptional repressor AcrR [Moellerella wisconsensis]UNH30157.1 multidrug efflux transporter transcriptional repressor 
MARKTKQQAEITRQEIIDAAIKTFSERGVSTTSLADIAKAAGVTRGAIYWHFKNKADLFYQACEFSDSQILLAERNYRLKYINDPLSSLRELLIYILTEFIDNPKNRALMEIFFHKCEMVGEMAAVVDFKRENYMASHSRIVDQLQLCIDAGQLPANLNVECASIMVHSMISGILENWLFQPESFNIYQHTVTLVDSLIEMMRSSPSIRRQPAPSE